MPGKAAHYFGCYGELGHYFWRTPNDRGRIKEDDQLPWHIGHLDGGLLKNGGHIDAYNGKVFWTVAKDLHGGWQEGGPYPMWFAFFWWDNSVDSRPGSNSGFYVRGFNFHGQDFLFSMAETAFRFACEQWPKVVARQRHELVLVAK